MNLVLRYRVVNSTKKGYILQRGILWSLVLETLLYWKRVCVPKTLGYHNFKASRNVLNWLYLIISTLTRNQKPKTNKQTNKQTNAHPTNNLNPYATGSGLLALSWYALLYIKWPMTPLCKYYAKRCNSQWGQSPTVCATPIAQMGSVTVVKKTLPHYGNAVCRSLGENSVCIAIDLSHFTAFHKVFRKDLFIIVNIFVTYRLYH